MRIGTALDHTYLPLKHLGSRSAWRPPGREEQGVERPNRSGHDGTEQRYQVVLVRAMGKFALRLLMLIATLAATVLTGGAGIRPF